MTELQLVMVVTTLLLIGCKANTNGDELNQQPNRIKIAGKDTATITTDINEYTFVKGNVFDMFSLKNGSEVLFFDIDSKQLVGIENRSNSGLFQSYSFLNGTLTSEIRYYERGDGSRTTSEVIWYKNGHVDLTNSAFLAIEKLNESETTIDLQVDYLGGYTFLKGLICFGKMAYDSRDTIGGLSYKMENRSQQISIPKRRISGKKLIFTIFIERGIDREIDYRKTYPAKGRKSFDELYIKEVEL